MTLHRVTTHAREYERANIPLPADTRTANPQLAPLLDNGGPTRTHALLNSSPAIDRGHNHRNRQYDQRGPGFPRVKRTAPDIGAVEHSGLGLMGGR